MTDYNTDEGYFDVVNPKYYQNDFDMSDDLTIIKVIAVGDAEPFDSSDKTHMDIAWFQVYRDVENGNRAYVCIGHEMVYLDTMTYMPN